MRRQTMCLLAGVVTVAVCATGAGGARASQRAQGHPGAMRVAAVPAGPGSRLWAARYDSSVWAAASAVAVSPSGATVFVTGAYLQRGSSYAGYATVAYNAVTGARLWVARYNDPGNTDYASAVAVSPSGATVFVTGGTRGASGSYATVAYNATTGAQLWAARYTGPADGNNTANSVAVSPSGATVFVTGTSLRAVIGNIAYSDYATVAYSAATGAQLWAARYTGLGNSDSAASSLAVSPSGATVFVTGSSLQDSSAKFAYATLAYDAATGAQLWATRYADPGQSNNTASSVAVSPSGGTVFVTGSSQGRNSGSYATVAYNAGTGAQVWVARYSGTGKGANGASALAVSPSGTTVFVTGQSYAAADKFDYATLAYDTATGARLWAARYHGPANGTNTASSVAVSPSGGTVYVTGASQGLTSGYDYATVAYDAATGAQHWAARYTRYSSASNSGDHAFSVAVSPTTGAVFVTGESYTTDPNADYATVAYNG